MTTETQIGVSRAVGNLLRTASRPTLKQSLDALGLTSGLEFCLDAGDPLSYPGSGQKWLDTSGNGQDFFLGADGTVSATDPTFRPNGRKSTLAFDGGDSLTYDSSNETWMANIHKDSAAFAIGNYVSFASAASNQAICGTDTTGGTGFLLYKASAGGALVFAVSNGGVSVLFTSSGLVPSVGPKHFIGLSVDEASGLGHFMLDGVTVTFTSTYSSPSSGAATGTFQIGSTLGTTFPLLAGGEEAGFVGWSRYVTPAEMAQLFSSTRSGFGV